MELIVINAATSPGAKTLGVRGFSILELEIWGSASAATVNFYGAGISGNLLPRQAVRMSDFATGTSGSINEAWQLDVSMLSEVKIEVASVTGGNVSVAGRCK